MSERKSVNHRQSSGYISTVPPQEILPVVDSNFESSIKGIFVIGDATGFPLVKIAANQGAEVIQKISKQRVFEETESEFLDVAIIGAGPAGISAAIEAQKLGWKYVVLEKSNLANTVRGFPPGKMVYAEPHTVPNRSELDCEQDVDRDEFLQMMGQTVQSLNLAVKEDTEVAQIRKTADDLFEIETTKGKSLKCKRVIIAIGRQGNPRQLGIRGEELDKVSYRLFTSDDHQAKKILVVGGGNSAIESALLLMDSNEVTLSYRGDNFYRAKDENRRRIEKAISEKRIKVIFESEVKEIRSDEVELEIKGKLQSIPNDQVVVQIGTLPPIDFLLDTGIELDGIWTAKRFLWATFGIAVGLFIYFVAKHFTLVPEASNGEWLVPGIASFDQPLATAHRLIKYLLPIPWLALLGVILINKSLELKQKPRLVRVAGLKYWLIFGGLLYYCNFAAPQVMTLDPELAGPGPYYLPGFSWLFSFVPTYFSGLGSFYYLIYFSAILFFGIYWAVRINHPILWRRNLTIIAVQWTLWWGIPTFLVVFIGTNPWTPFLSRSINAWPLKMDAFQVDPSIVRPGDPEWWYLVGVVAVVWAVFLTFVVIPIFTIKFGKIYCSYVCSCGALAETVGNSFRHRGPKGDAPRKIEKYGFLFVVLAVIVTCASFAGWNLPLQSYNVWVGTFLAGAIAVGLYPFLGQRIWCRMWCPLAFWMNFWGRWSKFKISAEKGKCIDCNMCNQYCQMGIDIKSRALQGKPVTLVDTPCVGCAECVMRCPMEILHLGELPSEKQGATELPDKRLHQIGEK